MVKVYVWYPHTGSLGGHASMDIAFGEVGRSDYVSWWPITSQSKDVKCISGVPFIIHSYFQDIQADPKGEGGNPDWTMEFCDLNESNMLAAWNSMKKSGEYNLISHNCAHSVAYILAASGADIYNIVLGQTMLMGLIEQPISLIASIVASVWSPLDIITLCNLISGRNYLTSVRKYL